MLVLIRARRLGAAAGSRAQVSWADWMAVAEALAIGRIETLQAAKCNKPVGTTYNLLMAQWLKQHGLAGC
jgi:hypothetical protein